MDLMEYLDAVIKEYKTLFTICDVAEKAGIWRDKDMPLTRIYRAEIAAYIMYLCASDGEITDNEVRMYQLITGYSDSAESIDRMIDTENIYSEEFESTVPQIIQIACEMDPIFEQLGVTGKSKFVERLLGLYEGIGNVLIRIDGEVTESEEEDLSIYLDMIKEYMATI